MSEKKSWAKLNQEDMKTLGFSTYPGEVILVDWKSDSLSNENFYFNAQEFFSDYEISEMPWFNVWLFFPMEKKISTENTGTALKVKEYVNRIAITEWITRQ
jgi:hypothetical protein